MIDANTYRLHAFRLGVQYLASGRFAVAGGLTPVAANLLHHAIEMFLKGCLVKHIGFSGLPKGRDGHDLENLWSMFRGHVSDATLARFDSVIKDLHGFESIRYPETLIRDGGRIAIGFAAGARSEDLSTPKPTLPEYQLRVDDIDALVKELFRIGSVNADALPELAQEDARKYLAFRNLSPLLSQSAGNAPQLDTPT
jgi:hypothetical protein